MHTAFRRRSRSAHLETYLWDELYFILKGNCVKSDYVRERERERESKKLQHVNNVRLMRASSKQTLTFSEVFALVRNLTRRPDWQNFCRSRQSSGRSRCACNNIVVCIGKAALCDHFAARSASQMQTGKLSTDPRVVTFTGSPFWHIAQFHFGGSYHSVTSATTDCLHNPAD